MVLVIELRKWGNNSYLVKRSSLEEKNIVSCPEAIEPERGHTQTTCCNINFTLFLACQRDATLKQYYFLILRDAMCALPQKA